MKRLIRCILLFLVAAALLLPLVSCGDKETEPDPTEPEPTEPTQPTEPEPEPSFFQNIINAIKAFIKSILAVFGL